MAVSAFHQTFEVIGHGLGGDSAFHAFDDQVCGLEPLHVAQHHLCGQDDGARVHFVLAGILRRSTVSRFEQRALVTDVGARGDTDTANLRRQGVRDIVAVQVHTGDNVVFRAEYDVIACMNLNGDYISDALAAQVGGIGIAPGANIGDECALFEATHGTAPKYAGQDKVNPGSIILSAEMMLRHMQWFEAADLIVKGMEGAIAAKTVTYDFERLMEGRYRQPAPPGRQRCSRRSGSYRR